MFIYNSPFITNPTFGKSITLNWRKRPEQMAMQEVANVITLAKKYNKAHNFITSMNGPYTFEFKKLCQNLIAGQRKFGLVFTNILQGSKDKIQIAKLNKKDEHEILTFSWLNEENKSIKKYRICDDGSIFSPSAERKKQMPFDSSIVPILDKELDRINSIIDNYNYLKKTSKKSDTSFSVLADEMQYGTTNVKTEIDKLLEAFNSMRSFLQKHPKKAHRLKQAFWKESLPRSKSYTFKNVGPMGETYSLTPSHLYEDGRNSIIQILDKNNTLKKIYILYNNGNIKTAIDYSKKPIALYSSNLRFVTKSSKEEEEINKVINFLQKKFSAFNAFADNQTLERITTKSGEKITKTPKQKKQNLEEIKNVDLRIALAKKEAEEKKHQKIIAARHKAIRTAQKKSAACKNEFTSLEITNPEMLTRNYLDIKFESLAQVLKDVFSTPIEQRSSHLVHEKLPDGRIFGGRFSFNASDGAKVTVSQKVSNKIWNFKYYSIKVENGDINYIINLDYDNGQFINSTKEGKILLNQKGTVSYLSRGTMLKRTPDIINLPQYIKELCISNNTQPKQIVDFTIKKSTTKSLIEQNEQEIEEKLQELEQEDSQQL